MNILDIIKQFEREYYYFNKDNYYSVFSASDIIIDYYSQQRLERLETFDELTDAIYAHNAYTLIHDPNVNQEFCDNTQLLEYNNVLHKYFNGRTPLEVERMIQTRIIKGGCNESR